MNQPNEFAGAIESKALEQPSIFTYLDYRKYLSDIIEFLKARGEYSVRGFARKVGLGSANYLQIVIRGDRNLGDKFVLPLAEALGLSKNESLFFQTLIKFNSTTDAGDKDRLFRQLLKFKAFKKVRRVVSQEYELFSDWRNVALYEGINTAWAQRSRPEMAKDLSLAEDELERRLRILEELKLIEQREGKWVKLDAALDTEPLVHSLSVRNFHRQMIQKGLESVDRFSPAERSLGAMTLPLTESTFRHLERRLNQLRAEITALHAEEVGAENVYQLNIQFFPLLKK